MADQLVRLATKEDLEVFGTLWKDFLEERAGKEELGVLVTPKALRFYLGMFTAYVDGTLPGVVLLAEERGALMWGSPGEGPLETSWDPWAHGWGTYVVPSARGQGLSTALREEAKRRLKELGFRAVLGEAAWHNGAGAITGVVAGFVPVRITGLLEL